MFAPETAKAMAKCGSWCINNFEEVLIQYSSNGISKIDAIKKFALTVFNCTIKPLSVNYLSSQSLSEKVCLKNLILFESRFNKKDLIYGIYYGGDIDKIRKRFGGVLMAKFMDNGKYTHDEIIAASKALIDSEVRKGTTIRFTLSGIQDLKGVMEGTASRIPAVTKAEIEYIRGNWDRLGGGVKWYLRDVEVLPPWLWKEPWVKP